MPFLTFFNLPEEKRQRILDCAIDEFAENDYDSASISKIVARAGIAKGSLYQYFADKSDLYHYLLELALQKKAELLSSTKLPEPDKNVFETLRHLFQIMAGFEVRYPQLAKIGYRAVHSKSQLPEDIMASARRSTQQYFIELIEEGKKQGEIRPEIDANVTAFIFTATLTELGNSLIARAGFFTSEDNFSGRTPELEKIYNQIVSILQVGIAK
jgi:AcrR family transcriptional regulator